MPRGQPQNQDTEFSPAAVAGGLTTRHLAALREIMLAWGPRVQGPWANAYVRRAAPVRAPGVEALEPDHPARIVLALDPPGPAWIDCLDAWLAGRYH